MRLSCSSAFHVGHENEVIMGFIPPYLHRGARERGNAGFVVGEDVVFVVFIPPYVCAAGAGRDGIRLGVVAATQVRLIWRVCRAGSWASMDTHTASQGRTSTPAFITVI